MYLAYPASSLNILKHSANLKSSESNVEKDEQDAVRMLALVEFVEPIFRRYGIESTDKGLEALLREVKTGAEKIIEGKTMKKKHPVQTPEVRDSAPLDDVKAPEMKLSIEELLEKGNLIKSKFDGFLEGLTDKEAANREQEFLQRKLQMEETRGEERVRTLLESHEEETRDMLMSASRAEEEKRKSLIELVEKVEYVVKHAGTISRESEEALKMLETTGREIMNSCEEEARSIMTNVYERGTAYQAKIETLQGRYAKLTGQYSKTTEDLVSKVRVIEGKVSNLESTCIADREKGESKMKEIVGDLFQSATNMNNVEGESSMEKAASLCQQWEGIVSGTFSALSKAYEAQQTYSAAPLCGETSIALREVNSAIGDAYAAAKNPPGLEDLHHSGDNSF